MATIPYYRYAEAEGLAKQVYDDIVRTYGATEPHGIYQLMGHTPEFLAASWTRSRFLYGTQSNFSIKDKHIFTLGISATNNCEYCVRIHTSRLRGLGMSPAELIELMMVVDLVNGLAKFAEGTRAGDGEVLPVLAEEDAEGRSSDFLHEIGEAEGNRVPNVIYRLMAHLPEYLRASWDRAQRCFQEEGQLGLRMKLMLAYCVAATVGNDFHVRLFSDELRGMGVPDQTIVEMLLVIDLACGYNRYVQGLQTQQEEKPFGPGAEADKTLAHAG